MTPTFRVLACLAVVLCCSVEEPSGAQEEGPTRVALGECLVLPAVGVTGRSPVRVDALEISLIRNGFVKPRVGDGVKRHDGLVASWRAAKPDAEGWIGDGDLAGGYAWWTVNVAGASTWLLKARGHSLVYVNGELRGGDPYSYGYVTLPVALVAGDNQLLFGLGRGRVKAKLEAVPAGHCGIFIGQDWTLPDIPQDSSILNDRHHASVNVINATNKVQRLHSMGVGFGEVIEDEGGELIPPMSTRKIRFTISGSGKTDPGKYKRDLVLFQHSDTSADSSSKRCATATFEVEVKLREKPRKITFISRIDGSVQYYGLLPAKPLAGQTDKPGIVLSLHGASVEAIGQASAYSPKSWCHIVCPTNRRPYGFDWEDWGRLDAMEVLEHSKKTLDHDPSKIWLTGHSMGGHGAWTIGAHFPDRFAAIGPSAGWESFWSYAGGGGHPPEHKLSPILTRGAHPSRTMLLKHNYKAQGVYILHGDADDNVPVTQARTMRDALKEFHTALQYHEEPGAGHWWDGGNDGGADCVDWAPMFDMFAKRRLPASNEVLCIDFTTVCPGNSDRCHWASIHTQQVQLEPSRIRLRAEPNRGRVVGETDNVARLRLEAGSMLQPQERIEIELDGDRLSLEWPKDGVAWLCRLQGKWVVSEAPSPRLKGPHRYGLLKNAMRNNFALVYGTGGTAEEKAWMFNKARYDAEQWQYRANGAVDILPDSEFDIKRFKDRDVVLYGNAHINSAFAPLVDAPVQLRRGKVSVGGRTVSGDDLACLFCFPMPGSDSASVCVVGGTGLAGMRITDRLSYFVSGAAFPDFILYGSEMLEQGTAGVRAAGYFGEDWDVTSGEFVWRDEK